MILDKSSGDNWAPKKDSVNILGTEYKILFSNYKDEPEFNKGGAMGFCSTASKRIVLCRFDSCPDEVKFTKVEKEALYKEALRHEVIHAYLFESGLDNETFSPMAWARSEEIIDWIAIQSPKMFANFRDLGIDN